MTQQPSQPTTDDVEILSQETVYKGFFSLEKIRLRHRLFAGGWSDAFNRECLMRPYVAAALPYDPKQDKVVLIEQFRAGVLKGLSQHREQFTKAHSPWLLELVAGIVEKGESLEDLATREAKEEAGLDVRELIPIHDYWSSPGGTSERVALFCALVDATDAGGIHGLAHEHEDIRVTTLSSQEAFEAVRTGRIDNAATIIGLQWLELRRESIQAKHS